MRRLLFITASDPAAIVGGGGTATRSIIDSLRAPPMSADVTVASILEQSQALPHRIRQFSALLRSVTSSSMPSKALFALPRGALSRLGDNIASTAFDLIIFNALESYPFAAKFARNRNVVTIVHNAETELFRRQVAKFLDVPIVGSLFRRDLSKLAQLERRALADSKRVICLSSTDAASLRPLAPDSEFLVLPPAFSYAAYDPPPAPPPTRPLKLAFLARYQWWPNAEAVAWLADHVLERLPPNCVEVLLFGPGAERFADRHPYLTVRGEVADLAEVWRDGDLFICPMVSGSGINIKFIEALYNRQPVLATPFSQRGLTPIDDPAVRFIESADDWVDFLQSEDAELLAQLRPREDTTRPFSRHAASQTLADFLRPRPGTG